MSAEAAAPGTGPGGPTGLEIHPVPTDEEAAAIAAAVYVGWPRPAAEVDEEAVPTAWRFSGRWWRTPTWRRPIQRRRP